VCEAYCSCLAVGVAGTDLLTSLRTGLSGDQTARLSAIIGQCREGSATPFDGDASPAEQR
jgi:hypothetical protein